MAEVAGGASPMDQAARAGGNRDHPATWCRASLIPRSIAEPLVPAAPATPVGIAPLPDPPHQSTSTVAGIHEAPVIARSEVLSNVFRFAGEVGAKRRVRMIGSPWAICYVPTRSPSPSTLRVSRRSASRLNPAKRERLMPPARRVCVPLTM